MTGASKILTVSYGTFSCTLEGFDDPFNTMKAIAEYFRDLAAEDRYFGAEPPTPDAAMLHKIAEREIQRRVESKIEGNGVILRAHENVAPKVSFPSPAAAEPVVVAVHAPTLATLADAAPAVESAAVRLSRLRAAQSHTAPQATVAVTAPLAAPAQTYIDTYAEDAEFADPAPAVFVPEPQAAANSAAKVAADKVAADLEKAAAKEARKAKKAKLESEEAAPVAVLSTDVLANITKAMAAPEAVEPAAILAADIPAEPVASLPAPLTSAPAPTHDSLAAAIRETLAGLGDGDDQLAADMADANSSDLSDAADAPLADPADLAAVEDYLPETEAVIALDDQSTPVFANASAEEYDDEDAAFDALSADEDSAFDAAFDAAFANEEAVPVATSTDTPATETAPVPEAVTEFAVEADAETMADAQLEPDAQDPEAALAADLALKAGDVEEDFAAEDAVAEDFVAETASAEVVQAEATPVEDAVAGESAMRLAAEELETSEPTSNELAPEELAPEVMASEELSSNEPAPQTTSLDSAAETIPAPSDKIQRARARVIKVRRVEPTPFEPAPFEPALTSSPAIAAPFSASTAPPATAASMTAQDEADLENELAALEAELGAPAAEAKPVEANRLPAAETDDAAVNRLLEKTNSELEVPETKRRRSAIAHLKAAVLATVAERRSNPKGQAPDTQRMDTYRKDLDQVMRPTPSDRPAPLVLVSSQRIDRKPEAARPQSTPSQPAFIQPVRPRRVSAGLPSAQSATQSDADYEQDEVANIFVDPSKQSFAEFAESLNATSMHDLIEAAGAYCTLVLGRGSFTRPELFEQVSSVNGPSETAREDGLRGFGRLLRDGRLTKTKRGEYTLAETSPLLNEARRRAS